MDREQAVEIHAELLEAALALCRAEGAIFVNLDKKGRAAFAEPLDKVVLALHREVLPLIYNGFPDLRDNVPTISSHLTWDKVRLPPGISEADVDAIIFSFMKTRWQKVARIIGQSLHRCRELGLDISDEAFGARILELAEADLIEGTGHLQKWGWSEIRLREPASERLPTISSELRWDQVRLPANVSEADIDAILFSILGPDLQKMAAVVGDAVVRCGELGLEISAAALAARIQALAESGRIEAVGDLRMWRFSEVRLKD
jgi:hypothetical protein